MTQPFAHWSTITRLLVGLLLLVLPLGGLACGGGDDETPSPGVTLKSITVSPATANVAVGATQQFAVNGVYSDGKTKAVTTGVAWTSSTTTVATINTSGLATAVADGSTTITATVGKLKGTATLTVITKALTGIQVTPASASIGVGTTQQYAATANYNDGTTTDVTASATWSSSDTATATISATGLASGVAAGTSTISAMFETVTGTAILTVTDNAMTGIVVAPATASIPAGATQAFTATAQYADGTTQDVTADVTWTSSDAEVATIAGGTATGVAVGTATITAAHAASGLSGTAELTVTEAEITELQITPATEDAIVGGPTVEFTATAIYSDGTSVDVTDTATWTSDDDAIATIDAGVATAVAAGVATITAEFDGQTDTAELTVTDAVLDSIVVTPATASIPAGTTQQFTAVGYYNNGTSLDVSTTADWVSSAMAVATVSNAGLATGVAAGTSTITATLAGVSGSAELTVTDVVLTSIQITPAVASIADGATQAYTALGTYSDNNTADLTNIVSWNSSAEAVATIAANGLATAVAPGTTTITAVYQGITSNSATLVVTNIVVTGISVTCAATTIADGTDTQCTAQATYSDMSTGNVTSLATWTTDADTIASVNQMGLVSGEGPGTATITAAYQGFSGNVDITVTTATLTAIQVTPATPSIADGSTQQFVATGTYSDGSTQVITTDVTWTSSNTTVATITLGGLATGNAPGQSTITAALPGVTGTATLTVTAATVDFLTIAPLTPSIAKGATVQFTVTATFTDGTTQNVTSSAGWTTSAVATATVVGGLATGVEVGTATITATYGGQSAGTLLTVTGAVVTSVQVTPATATIADGATQQFTAVAILSDGTNTGALSTGVTWTSSAGTVATINAAGLATAVNPGTTNIRATYQTVQSAPAVLTVTNAVPTSLSITPATASIADGTTQQFVATVTLSDGTTQNVTSAASWTSSSTATATVVAGLATSVNPGTTTITATYQTLSDTSSLTVTAAALTGITITTTDNSIALGTSTSFTAVGSYTDGTSQQISHLVTWTQTPTGVLSFGTATAASVPAQGATVGTTVVRANVGAMLSNTLSVTVTAAELTGLAITPAAAQSLFVGQTLQFTATGTYSDGTTQPLTTDAALTWTSSAGSVVISNAADKGLATALTVGSANIRANVGTIQSNQVAVTVTAAPALLSITLTPTTWTTNVGSSTIFAATANYQDGSSALLVDGTWTVENLAGAAANNVSLALVPGLAHQRNATAISHTTALPGGVAYVAVAKGAIKARASVDVNDTTVTSVAVACAAPTACLPTGVGYTAQCTATATYSDLTTGDVTDSAIWSVTTTPATGVATAQTGGSILIGSTQGTISVFATSGGVANTVGVALTSRTRTISTLSAGGNFTLPIGGFSNRTATATYPAVSGVCAAGSFNVTTLAGWTSSNTAVATVNDTTDKGRVDAVSAGLSSITVSFSGLNAVATATVTNACIAELNIGSIGVDNEVPTNITAPLTVTATYSDGSSAVLAGTAGTWSSTPAGAVVNGYLHIGTVDVSATYTHGTASQMCSGVPTTATINAVVDPAAVLTGVSVATIGGQTTAQIPLGGEQDFVARATYTGYGEFNVSPYATWSNSPAISGLADAASPTAIPARRFDHTGSTGGTTNVLANYKTLASNTVPLTISGLVPASVAVLTANFTPPPRTAAPAASQGYPGGLTVGTIARVTYSDGTTADNPACISWQSSHPSHLAFASATSPVATTYTNAAAQTVTITATCGTVSGTANVQVNTATLTNLTFNPASPVTRAANLSFPLTVNGVYTVGATNFNFNVTSLVSFANNDPTIAQATTSSGSLMVQTYNEGTATIDFTKDTITRGYVVNVTGACISQVNFEIPTANPVNLGVNQTADFRAIATDTASGTTNVTGSANGTWSATNAFLTNLGNFGSGATLVRRYQGASLGETEVKFTYTATNVCDGGNFGDNTIEVTRAVNVIDKVISTLEIQPQPVAGQTRRRIPAGQHIQLALIATYTDGTSENVAANSGTAWSINNTGAAVPTVNATGLLFAGATVGIDEVQATYAGLTRTLAIDVYNCGAPTLTISTTATGNLPIGQTRDYAAVAQYAACATLDASELGPFTVTPLADWNSSVAARAAFQTAGVPNRVTGLAAGATNITAQYNGDTSNTIALTVVSVTLQSLAINASGSSVFEGGTLDITVSAVWTDGTNTYTNIDPPANLTWVIGDPTAISITATADPTEYVLTGLDAVSGVTYRARFDTINSNTLTVNVTTACINDVRIANGDMTMPTGTYGALDFECQNSAAPGVWTNCPTTGSAFSTTDATIVAVDPTTGAFDVVGAVDEFADLTATYTGAGACAGLTLADTVSVTVGTATLQTVEVTGPDTVARNVTAQYTATATFGGGTGAGSYVVTDSSIWASTNTAVAWFVANDGLLTTANTSGTTYISATYGGVTSPLKLVTVNDKVPTSVSVSADWNLVNQNSGPLAPLAGAEAEYPTGEWLLQLHATVNYSDGTADTDPATGSVWSLQGTALTDVSVSNTGLFNTGNTANNALQTVRVVYSYNGESVQDDFIIRMRYTTTNPSVSIRNTTNTGAGVGTVPDGLTQPYGARVLYNGRYYWGTRNVSWLSATPAVGTIQQTGAENAIFTALTLGSTQITADAFGGIGALTVNVIAATPQSVYCAPATLTLNPNAKAQLLAFVRNSDGSENEVTTAVGTTWASSDNALAEFLGTDPKGVITAKDTGTAYGIPTYAGLTATGTDRCAITIP